MFFLLLVVLFAGCKKEDSVFTLKTVKLNKYPHTSISQRLYLKVFNENLNTVLSQTDVYPSDLTLPASFSITPQISLKPYKEHYRFELWGDVSGLIGSCQMNMDDYKIIFPIDMEVKSDSLIISATGSWR